MNENKKDEEEENVEEETLPDSKLEIKSNEININYINSSIFKFYDENKRNVYSLKFNSDFSHSKIIEILFIETNNSIFIYCKKFLKVQNGKWFFYFVVYDGDYFGKRIICLAKEDEINNRILEIQMAEKIENLRYNLRELDNDKFLFYEYCNFMEDYLKDLNGRINVIDTKSGKMNKTIFAPFEKPGIEDAYYLKEYKNLVFVSLFKPLLILLILDFELNQINTIIELTESIYIPNDFYFFRPFIRYIKSVDNNKLLIIGGQHLDEPGVNSDYLCQYYNFKIVFNLEKFEIEYAEHEENRIKDNNTKWICKWDDIYTIY